MNNKIKENLINCSYLFIFLSFSFSFPQINLKLHLILESKGKKIKKNGFFFSHLDTSEKMIRKTLLNKDINDFSSHFHFFMKKKLC